MTKARPLSDADLAQLGPGEKIPSGPNQRHGLYVFDAGEEVYESDGRRVFAYRLSDGRPACGSRKAKRPGRCESTDRLANGRCKHHGGKSLKGPASPAWKTGRHSRYMPPPELLTYYQLAVNDPELIQHRDSTALLDAMIQAALDDYEEGGTPALWTRVRHLWSEMEIAYGAKDRLKWEKTRAELGYVIERGATQAEREKHIVELSRERRQHAVAETKRLQTESQTFTYEAAYAFYVRLGAIVREFVKDEEVRRRIADAMTGVAGPLRNGPRALVGQDREEQQ